MKYMGTLLAVSDMARSLDFYREVFGEQVGMDFGANVGFKSGLSLQAGFAELAGFDPESVKWQTHNAELYYEEDDLDGFLARVRERADFRPVHEIKEYPWGQRVVRLYDPDGHIIEVGESMGFVVVRFLQQGMTDEEVAERSMFPVEMVRMIRGQMESGRRE